MGKVGAVIVAAGSGKRMGTDIPKQFLLLNDEPIIRHTVEKFQNCKKIDEIVVVTGKEHIKTCLDILKDVDKLKTVVSGGKERQDSVVKGIEALSEDCEYVLIHDGVRPFIKNDDILRVIEAVKKWGACVMAVKSKDTVKIAKDGFVKATPDRSALWNAQTPQAFKTDLIKKAYKKAAKEKAVLTDDAMAAELLGEKVRIVEGGYYNIKITTPEDLKGNIEL
ncbi:MAG: 2-C-methyl-D-erythritol 4-phosphate cytidylyltransferase [Clostridiales bacterium]|nr:2-C-methyl-D-erythritol 4-phosphate cytidylyltransferase [Clostridiales bacterium]